METEITFRILFWIQLGILLVIRGVSAFRVRQAGERLTPDKAAVQREGAATYAFRIAAFLILVAFLVSYAIYPAWMADLSILLPVWLRWVGFILGLAGLGLLAWSQAELGRQWSTNLQLRQDHRLVTSGPYATIRHPLYTSMLIFEIGFALLTANWIFVAFAGLVTAGLWLRVPKEEQMMLEQFGEEYRGYMKHTHRFFPFGRQ
jgi:protein-S-isoprenylcysteine O-methyltransferase Ste14